LSGSGSSRHACHNAAVTTVPAAQPASAWTPLRYRMFRIVWLAQLGSNIGTWMQMVGAQWLLVDEPNASSLVALVQTASSLPFLVFGLISGVLADVFDRRRYLMGLQAAMVVVAGLMAGLTAVGHMPPTLLLTLTFLLATGAALSLPAWQATTPSLVPRPELPSAVALSGMNQNLARVVGPAIAGVVIAQLGTAVVFAINAISFAGGIVAMLLWRRPPADAAASALERERLGAAMAAGTRYVRHAPTVQRLLLRLILFVVPATALWALLPVVASQRLGLDASGYGLLLAALGAGAILGAIALPWLSLRLSPTPLIGVAAALYAATLVVTGLSRAPALVVLSLVPAGLAWLVTVVSVMGRLQQVLPGWVRARGLAVSQLAFMGGQAVAAVLWGLLANQVGVPATFLAAAALLAAGSATAVWWPLPDVARLDRTPAQVPLPSLAFEPRPADGPVLVTHQYAVRPENAAAFVAAMRDVERSRRRTGAVSWNLYREGEDPARFLETYVVRTWAEHLHQHHRRLTGNDRLLVKRAIELSETRPVVAHLFPADTDALSDQAITGER
jgi:MFS family permease